MLAYFLKASEGAIIAAGAKTTINLDDYSGQAGAGDYEPTSALDILKNVLPRISTIMSTIKVNFHMYPTYIVSGIKTAALLRSLQDVVVNFAGVRGELGWTGATAQFAKLQILESPAIDNNKIYLSTKAPQNALERTTIVDLIYQPLYVVKEVTDGNTRNFVRSRTCVEICRTDGLGLIEVNNMQNYMG